MSALPISIDSFDSRQFWGKTPRKLDLFQGRGLTQLDKTIWHLINQAVQIQTRRGQISTRELARFAECTERAVYNSRRRLRAAGMLTSFGQPGCTTMYGLPWQYAGRPVEQSTDERSFRGSSEQPFRGQGSGHVPREDNAHSGKDNYPEKKAVSLERTGLKVCAPPVATPKPFQDGKQNNAPFVQPAAPEPEIPVRKSPKKSGKNHEKNDPAPAAGFQQPTNLTTDNVDYQETPELAQLRTALLTLPVKYALDTRIFRRIAAALASRGKITAALVAQFQAVAVTVENPRKWAVYVDVALAVAARGIAPRPPRPGSHSSLIAGFMASREAGIAREASRLRWDAEKGSDYEGYVRQCAVDGIAPVPSHQWPLRE